ncbi:glycogen-binding subunit 76A [Anopheles marshallii]|uniref:glycogen-binding subunit 76A n=1 Tax=Anopheles marshallii TaxID=1521116 RepID=UPI00237B2866|nr:glycogen-binding subunit 76A [Anopheles marshallii]
MTTSGDPSATGPDRPCGITALLPSGMSCRSRAEAFARSLQSRLRNLGSQGSTGDDDDDEGRLTAEEQQQQHTENTWLSAGANDQTGVTSLQPLRMIVANEADSCFDFGLEAESPSSPVEECEYTRLIETATATPTSLPSIAAVSESAVVQAPESGYVCSSPCSTPQGSAASSHSSSSDCQFYDPDSSDPEQRSVSGCEYYDCTIPVAGSLRSVGTGPYSCAPPTGDPVLQSAVNPTGEPAQHDDNIAHKPTATTSANNPFTGVSLSSQAANGHIPGYTTAGALDSDSCSESLPPSQSTESNISTFTGMSSNSNSTLQDVTMEPLDDQPGADIPDGVHCSAPHRMGNGHAIMPRGTVINADTELGLMGRGLKYEEDSDVHGEDGAGGAQCTTQGAAIQIAEVEKILHDCTMTDRQGETVQNNHEHSAYNDADDDEDRKQGRRATMSSGDEDEEETKPQRIRRCSSLKTGKTPPGTPGRKKIVRFADVLGLDLTDVRTFMDEVPKVPQSAFEDLTIAPAVEQPMPEIISLGPKVDRVLVPLFQQPGALPCFLDRVREKQVNLENAAVTDPITLTITGTVRVRNLDFHKSVYVRYTLDNWRSYADLQAVYAENSCDGFSDKFSFTLHGNSVQVGQRIEMAIRFHCRGEQFWDSNYDTNYVFQCLPITQPTPMIAARPLTEPSTMLTSSEPAWCSNFY